MVESYTIEGVLQRKHALDFMGFHHREEYVAHREGSTTGRQWRLKRSGYAVGGLMAGKPVRYGEDRAEVVGRMTPFRREPRVVEVEPANDCADIERSLHGIQFVSRAWDSRAVRDRCTRHDWPQDRKS